MKKNYQNALNKSNYKHELSYSEEKNKVNREKKKRRRKIIYFQPPFSLGVQSRIGRQFLNLVKKHFHQAHPLYKILNYRCLKLSYCCLNNIKSEIRSHNNALTADRDGMEVEKLCNCRKPTDCPMRGECLKKNLVYRADITTDEGDDKLYIGSAGNDFKERFRNHKVSLSNKLKRNTTELSKFYWSLIEQGKTPKIKWSIVKIVKKNFNTRNGCTLCNTERYLIAKSDKRKILNKRNELKRVCPHYKSNYFWNYCIYCNFYFYRTLGSTWTLSSIVVPFFYFLSYCLYICSLLKLRFQSWLMLLRVECIDNVLSLV